MSNIIMYFRLLWSVVDICNIGMIICTKYCFPRILLQALNLPSMLYCIIMYESWMITMLYIDKVYSPVQDMDNENSSADEYIVMYCTPATEEEILHSQIMSYSVKDLPSTDIM